MLFKTGVPNETAIYKNLHFSQENKKREPLLKESPSHPALPAAVIYAPRLLTFTEFSCSFLRIFSLRSMPQR